MKFLEQRQKLLQLDQMIRQRNTGTPKEACEKIGNGICESSFYNLLALLRELAEEKGVKILFSELNTTYYYSKHVELQIGFSKKEMITILGGENTLQDFWSDNFYFYSVINSIRLIR